MSSRRRRQRNVALALAGILLVWWSFSTDLVQDLLFGSAFADLERHMNDGPSLLPQIPTKSSFDWSKVRYQFPAGALTPVPTTGRDEKDQRQRQRLRPVQRKARQWPKRTAAQEMIRDSRRLEVRQVFADDWEAYRSHAWLKDMLMPISGGFRDQFSGWAATLVDSLDTLWIMGMRDEFDEAVAAVAKLDFGNSTSSRVNTFETNIRYLGGLIAAYDLSNREALLVKAVELGDLLYAAFNTRNRMPVDFIDFETAKTGTGLTVEPNVVSASPGTLSLELTRLSQITGDPKYYDAIARVMDVFHDGQLKTRLPGLWPTYVSMSNKDVVTGHEFTLGGAADSLYEYLPKMHALLGGLEPRYEAMSTRFLDAAQALLFRPMIPGNEPILIPSSAKVSSQGDVVLDQETEHLACFVGGTYALAGKLLGNEGYVNIGAKLALGCVYSYRSFPTGMMPERLNMVACESYDDCRWNTTKFLEERGKQREAQDHLPAGFTTAKDPRYILRPEAIESVFIMYRITGDPVWQELGWDMFTAIANGTRTESGTHAAVQDVTRKAAKLPQEDYMESFWFAETLKYFYLLFSPPDIISLDDYVLNTEAHPFLRPK